MTNRRFLLLHQLRPFPELLYQFQGDLFRQRVSLKSQSQVVLAKLLRSRIVGKFMVNHDRSDVEEVHLGPAIIN